MRFRSRFRDIATYMKIFLKSFYYIVSKFSEGYTAQRGLYKVFAHPREGAKSESESEYFIIPFRPGSSSFPFAFVPSISISISIANGGIGAN